jgi:hypothetical protein
MNWRRIFTAYGTFCLFLLAGHSLAQRATFRGIDLSRMLDDKGAIWTLKDADFERSYMRMGFRWVSRDAKTTARASHRALTFGDYGVVEALARFKDKTLTELTFYLYTRGDIGDITEDSFTGQLKKLQESLDKRTGVRAVRMPGGLQSSSTRRAGRVWTTASYQLALEWGWTQLKGVRDRRMQPEYIRLRCQGPKINARGSYTSTARANSATRGRMVTTTQLRAHVKKGDDGDVMLDGVPMVDQGMKGYCAVATMERIMRYYGRDVDQHELAQVSKTSALGTSPSVMVDVLKKLGVKLGCKIRILESFSVKDFQRLVDKYNRAAKKKNGRPIRYGRVMDLGRIFRSMDPDILKAVRVKDAGYRKFQANVKRYADKGVPIAWGVSLGLVPERGLPQAGGGHMRIIIGYNAKTKEILYSDSWGRGHELKRMAMDDAWTITTGLYMVQPRGTSL